jgi:nitrite reductase/ring-hydroxylating ferredoxin subunit
MLRKEQNELLAQTSPGTAMGNMFRAAWQPALLAEELPENDCPPVRVTLLSERLIAWRDSQGRYASHDEFCAHRGVSLWFGRNEHGGLRCPYHGWKYDHTGQCIEVPSEPSESRFCKKVKLASYPLVERGAYYGLTWGRRKNSHHCRNGNSPWCRPKIGSSQNVYKGRVGSRLWRAESTPAMSLFCTQANSTQIHCSKARAVTNNLLFCKARVSNPEP